MNARTAIKFLFVAIVAGVILASLVRAAAAGPGYFLNAQIAVIILVGILVLILTLGRIRVRRSESEQRARGGLLQRSRRIAFIVLPLCVILAMGADAMFRHIAMVQTAENALCVSQQARESLGEPIRTGWPITGTINLLQQAEGWRANLTIPVHGSRSKGILHVIGQKKSGVWRIQTMYLTLAGSARRVSIAH